MSSHSYSVSGQRPASLQLNGGHVTGMTCPSKTSDSVIFDASGFAKIELLLGDTVRIEKRRGKRGDVEADWYVLVLGSGEGYTASISAYAYASGDTDNPGPENTRIDVRATPERFGPLSYYDDIEVIETRDPYDVFSEAS